ncbi:MAG TPA: hypothetical protein VEQ58_20285, partial [Polyangiaceae bacterium]|nr:hypothetical protein [Polyangiaceae bacterium]
AYVEQSPTGEGQDSLTLAFGRRDLPPDPGRSVASLPDAEQLGSFADFGLDSLFVTSQSRGNGAAKVKVTLFEGSTDRLPLAPYSLVTFSTTRLLQDQLALTFAVGAFSASGADDVLALGTETLENDWTLWLVPNIGSGQELPRQLQAELPPDLSPVDFSRAKTLGVAVIGADVDGDGRDEAVWLVATNAGGCALLISDIDAEQGTATLRQRLDLEDSCPAPQLAAWNLNGDGEQTDAPSRGVDLLVLAGDPKVAPRQLAIFWNDLSGGFSNDNQSFVRDPDGQDIRSFSAFTKSNGLVYAAGDALHIAKSREDARELNRIRALDLQPGFHDLRSVVVTDPSGDGIEDMAVADAQGLWLVKATLR